MRHRGQVHKKICFPDFQFKQRLRNSSNGDFAELFQVIMNEFLLQ
jgi:hypothetical protein